MANCKSCGAEIVWARTSPTSKNMPLDAKPVAGFVLKDPSDNSQYRGPIAKYTEVHVSHFSTCPNADEHRRQR